MLNITKKSKKNEGVALLLTGSELMSGDIVDSNSAMLAQMLMDVGIEVAEKSTLPDDEVMLAAAVERLTQKYSCLIINGGLGPTSDDLTAQMLATVCDRPLTLHKEAESHVRSWCVSRGYEADRANLKQALLPAQAIILPDAPGSAAAFYMRHNDCLILVTPGVPSELKEIMIKHGLELLNKYFEMPSTQAWQRFTLFGMGESRLQQLIDTALPELKTFYNIGFRAGLPTLELKLKSISGTCDVGSVALNEALKTIEPYLLGSGAVTLAECVVKILSEKNQTISFAESCTGGLIASEITKVSGSSGVFPGSIVSYSNEVKTRLLGVDEHILKAHGAVSQEVVEAMHAGILTGMQTDYAVAVTGIAGPGGGCESKPVGTVWLAWGCTKECQSIKLLIDLPRQNFQSLVAAIAFDLIRRQLLGLDPYESVQRWLNS